MVEFHVYDVIGGVVSSKSVTWAGHSIKTAGTWKCTDVDCKKKKKAIGGRCTR